MARRCEICGRGALTGNSRSHSNIATLRKQHLNMQTALYHGKRVPACARCVRTITKQGKS